MTRLIARLGLIVLAATSPPSSAAAQAITAIRAGRLVDVEKGQVRRDQLILVRGEHVESIRPGSAKVPAGARVIDLSRYTVLPGLIDCHTHLIGEVQTASVLLPLERSEAREALTGARNARATLLAGFTAVRDVGTYRALVDAALRDAINDGTVMGPRMRVAGAYVTVSTGGGELVGAAPSLPRNRSEPQWSRRRNTERRWRRMLTERKGSSVPCGPASARSSTGRSRMTRASGS